MIKNILALGLLSFSLFSCGDASGGNKNILPKDPQSVAETPHSDSSEHSQVADTVKKQDQSHHAENETKSDSIKTNPEVK